MLESGTLASLHRVTKVWCRLCGCDGVQQAWHFDLLKTPEYAVIREWSLMALRKMTFFYVDLSSKYGLYSCCCLPDSSTATSALSQRQMMSESGRPYSCASGSPKEQQAGVSG